MSFPPRSARSRITLWYSAALALPLAAFALVCYLFFADTLRDRTDAFVADALTVFTRELSAERRAGPNLDQVIERTLQEVRFREVDIVVLDESGTVVGVSPHVRGPSQRRDYGPVPDPERVVAALSEDETVDMERVGTVHVDGGDYRVMVRRLEAEGREMRLAGIYDLAGVEAILGRLRRLFLVAIPLFVAAAAAGGFFLVRRSFAPVSRMASRAAEIGANTLSERLPVAADDELGKLARVLNDLLDRLEEAFEQQRRFMTDAAHELRTPTAIVRSEADVTLSGEDRTEEEYRESLGIIRDAARRLTRVVDDIFLLARADAGHRVGDRATLRFGEVVRGTVRTVKPIADENDVDIRVQGYTEVSVRGDRDLLERLTLNLLDNAVRHSPEGGVVEVLLRTGEETCELSVVDHGPGIPEEDREHVFERFYRVDEARARNESTLTSGAGLGLSICRRIAELHEGRIELVAADPGRTEFRVTLPLESAAGA